MSRPEARGPADGALAVRCRGLVKRYGDGVLAVDGLDLDVRAGECFGLLGPNGAGKTTTVEILEGLLDPTGGEVEVLKARWSEAGAALRERIGVSLQQTHLPERLTVREILRLFRSFFRRGRAPEEVLRAVSLEEKGDSWYEKLSGGQKQRLAVACALVGDPELLFLDEPTTGLDPQSRLQLWDVVERFKQRGRTVILTTHYMDEAERLCDRVGVIDHGKAIALGAPRDLIASLGGQEVIELALDRRPGDHAPPGDGDRDDAPARVGPDGRAAAPSPADAVAAGFAALPGVRAVRPVAGGFALAVDPIHVALPAVLDHLRAAGRSLERLATRHATLEDVFVSLTGRGLRD